MSYGDERDFCNIKEIPQWFWDIIEKGARDEEKILTILREQTIEYLYSFQKIMLRAISFLNADVFLEHMDPELSEDGIHDIVWWVVSQGKGYYLYIWEHPEQIPENGDFLDLTKSFYGKPRRIYKEKGGTNPFPT
jgi:hypothetical protein